MPPENPMDDRLEEFFNPLHSLIENLTSEDPLGMIIRGHLYIEAELIALIEDHFPYPRKFDLTRISFPLKLDLAAAMGLFDDGEEDERDPYIYFNKVRNKLAHNLNQEIQPEDIASLYNAFGGGHMAFIETHLEKDKPTIEGLRQCIIALYIFLYVKRLTMKGQLVEMVQIAEQFMPGTSA